LQDIVRGFLEAIRLVLAVDPELAEIVWLSLRVSGIALLISTLLGIPVGVLLGLRRVPGHGLVTATLYTGMGLPPVVVGLFVYLLLSRSGPLGALGWLFTPKAMIVAQSIIAFPLVAGLTMAAVRSVDPAPPGRFRLDRRDRQGTQPPAHRAFTGRDDRSAADPRHEPLAGGQPEQPHGTASRPTCSTGFWVWR